ncbi:hypothetical protein N6B72_19395 [Chryseobacterium soli]|uniref:hypothetical protein n=1 Tax=Chryseobacterium soli TaxID=445961 RepID=UPI0029541DF7|nr:hypothetical protein [Chryseobacterium soli]MDV7699089.1 hypothetical protein [Chryseobacterium soli]
MKYIFLIILFFVGCSDKETSKKTDLQQAKYSFKNILGYKDTLCIKSTFQDCGEWGGHDELIKMYRSDRKIRLAYVKYKVNCGERYNTGSIIQKRDVTENLILSDSQQVDVMNYINTLMKLKFIDQEIGHSGNAFLVEDSKGELRIFHHGDNIHSLNNYNILMQKLGFSTVVIKNE